MESENSPFNPSALLDLKAELHKKYDSFQRAKLIQKSEPSRHTSFKCKSLRQPLPKEKDVKVPTKSLNDEVTEEDLALKKSQLALEAKAKLYEKITTNSILIDDEDNDKYLVDFQRKVLYDTPITKKGEKSEKHSSSLQENSTTSESKLNKGIYYENPVLADIKTDKSNESFTDGPVHYQNVRFNEVRDHGTGYFEFSENESKRKEQMDELNKLRHETQEQRQIAQRMQRKRKAILEARLAKVCERRNIDKSVVQTYTETETPENAEDAILKESVDLSSIPLPESSMPLPETQVKKEVKIRPWDIGKTNFTAFVPEKHKTISQNDWIKDRRSERPSEFAPPSWY